MNKGFSYERSVQHIRGTQISVEGSSPQVFGIDQRVHLDFRY